MVNASGKPFIFIAASASGAASLVYLLVWMHSFVLVFGDTALVTLALAVTFIGGLTIGTWIGGRLADCRPHLSLIAFGAIEIAAGLYGFASLWIFHLVASQHPAVYPSSADHGHFLTGVQLTLSALVMLPPAILMGGSLPLLARRAAVNESGLVRGGGEIYGFTALGAFVWDLTKAYPDSLRGDQCTSADAAGFPIVASPDAPPDSERIDFIFWNHDRHDTSDSSRRAMENYLQWELDLPAEIEKDGMSGFRIGAS